MLWSNYLFAIRCLIWYSGFRSVGWATILDRFTEGDLDGVAFAFQDQLRCLYNLISAHACSSDRLSRAGLGEIASLLFGCFAGLQRQQWHTSSALKQSQRQCTIPTVRFCQIDHQGARFQDLRIHAEYSGT
jgi:hypothetical protein